MKMQLGTGLFLFLLYIFGAQLFSRYRARLERHRLTGEAVDQTASMVGTAEEAGSKYFRPVLLETRRGQQIGMVRKVELHGAFVLCHQPLPVKSECRLILKTAGKPILALWARVIWHNGHLTADRVIHRGMAVRFLQLTAADRKQLEEIRRAGVTMPAADTHQLIPLHRRISPATHGSPFRAPAVRRS